MKEKVNDAFFFYFTFLKSKKYGSISEFDTIYKDFFILAKEELNLFPMKIISNFFLHKRIRNGFKFLFLNRIFSRDSFRN